MERQPEEVAAGLDADLVAEAMDVVRRMRRNIAADQIMRGGLPVVPVRDVLPAPSAALERRMVVVSGPPDELYVCLRGHSGEWEWALIAAGTPEPEP